MAERAQIRIAGVVQGVGFRPYVHSLAGQLGLRGFVSNTASGVLIEAEGERLAEFLDRLPREAPPLARIAGLTVTRLPSLGFPSFSIRPSEDLAGAFTLVSPDVSLCEDCRRELFDPTDRRHLYPFINCTNCGPRYSITRSVPYDRPNTTMASFPMCPDCDREYHDPKDRRFHAQPNACPVCGPQVEFRMRSAEGGVAPHPDPLPRGEREHSEYPLPKRERTKVRGSDAIAQCIAALQQGGIVAIKGLGGFHLACDATNEQAVQTLRDRKRRSNKPFAVMAPSIEMISRFCEVTPEEQQALTSPQRPIVVLTRRSGNVPSAPIAGAVAPGNRHIGFLLPYTPLHAVLFSPGAHRQGGGAIGLTALVMTSGNLSEEPIVRDNDEAMEKLAPLVDAFLLHDRDIFMRVDDSVIRVLSAECGVRDSATDCASNAASKIFIRRSRGFAPEPIALPDDGPEVLGVGADLKNTFTLTKGSWAIPSQHIGDMENYETLRFFEETLDNLKKVYRVEPAAIVHDLHPGYLSTKWALQRSALSTQHSALPLYGIQHHYAHIGSVMAEKGIRHKVIGVAFDGTGYGTDGTIWGGEFLIADIDGFERTAQLKYLLLPGGEAAIREPWRTAVSLVRQIAGDDAFAQLRSLGIVERQGEQNIRQVLQVASAPELSPAASGAGRYFDAISSLLGLCDRNTFEGEAAMALEALVVEGPDEDYPVDYTEKNGYTEIDLAPLVRSVLADLSAGRDKKDIATRFHNAFAAIIVTMTGRISARTGIRDVALSGGSFQNQYLLERAVALLKSSGMIVHVNSRMPPNDACISLGQAYIIRERLKKQ